MLLTFLNLCFPLLSGTLHAPVFDCSYYWVKLTKIPVPADHSVMFSSEDLTVVEPMTWCGSRDLMLLLPR